MAKRGLALLIGAGYYLKLGIDLDFPILETAIAVN
jgi:hypothetical protein